MLDNGELRQLTHVNRPLLDDFQLDSVEKAQFESRDGTEIEGFIFKPPGFNFDFKYPTLLRIHGGPVSQYDYNFNFEAQLFAANGYVVVMVNPRGRLFTSKNFPWVSIKTGAQNILKTLWQVSTMPSIKDLLARND